MLELKYLKVKNIILKNYLKQDVYVTVKGNIDTRIPVKKPRILITKRKIVLSNEDTDFTIDLYWVKKVEIEDKLRIMFLYNDDLQVIMEV